MDTVKKIMVGLFLVLFLPSVLTADVLDDELPNNTPLQIKEMAREVINLGVENHGVVKMTNAMIQNKFTEEEMIRAYKIIGETMGNGLPEKPVMDKLYEGIGKRVNNQNIITAMEKVMERYQAASRYAQKMTENNEQAEFLTGDIEEVLAAGITGKDIERIGEMLNQLKIQTREKLSLKVQTLATIKTMARTGARSESVISIMRTALKNGYDQNKMKNLENAFMVQLRRNHNPSEIADFFTRGINAGISVDEMGRQGYMNSAGSGGTGDFGNGFGSGNGAGMGGTGGTSGGSDSGGMGGSGNSSGGGGGGSGGGGGRGGR
jgi:hypothetical protein